MKEELIQIRISSEMKEALKKLAEAENRTMSNYITTLIDREIKKATK